MSKIQKQRDEFVSSIDTSDWDQYSQSDRHFIRLSTAFGKYHEMMMEYRVLNAEQFVKKYWLFFYRDRKHMLSLSEEKINNQKSNFSINYESCALRIIDQMVDEVSYRLDIVEKR